MAAGGGGGDALPWPLHRGTSLEVGRLSESCAPRLVLPVCPRGLSPRRVRDREGTRRPFRQPSGFISFGMSSPAQRKKESEVAQLCPTLCDLMDCNPPGSSVHGIFQARVLEWIAISSPGDLADPGIEPGYHQPKGFYTFRPSITNTYHNLEECDLSVGISEHTRSQVAWFPLLAKVRLVLFNQNAVSVITVECPHVLHGAPSAMLNSSKGSRTSNCKELPVKNRIT